MDGKERRSRARCAGAVWLCAAAMAAGLLAACDEAPPEGGIARIKYSAIFGGLGDTPGRFAYPRAIDHDGTALWVIDKSARVQKIDPKTGACLAIFRMPEWDLGKPTGFCIAPGPDADGKWCDSLLWVADTHYHRVVVFRAEGGAPDAPMTTPRPVAQWGAYGSEGGQFIFPTDVAVALKPGGKAIDRIFVSEYGGNDRISVFDASHAFMYTFGKEGRGDDPKAIEFNRPQSMVIRQKSDGSSELVVVDACNHRLGRFTLEGKLIGWVGGLGAAAGPGKDAGRFSYPYGVAILPDGTALVSEFGGARIQHIDLDTGRGLGVWGGAGREPGQILAPWALTLMGDSVYLLDSGNNRIVGLPRPR